MIRSISTILITTFFLFNCSDSDKELNTFEPEINPADFSSQQDPKLDEGWKTDNKTLVDVCLKSKSSNVDQCKDSYLYDGKITIAQWGGVKSASQETARTLCKSLGEDINIYIDKDASSENIVIKDDFKGIVFHRQINKYKYQQRNLFKKTDKYKYTTFLNSFTNHGGGTSHSCIARFETKIGG